MLGLWLLAVIGLITIGVQQATHRAFDGEQVNSETLAISPQDTLFLRMRNNPDYSSYSHRGSDFKIKYDENDQKVLYSSDVRLSIKSTRVSVARLEIVRSAEGKDYVEARDRARNIDYGTSFSGNELLLDSYFTTPSENKFRDQQVRLTLYLPEGTRLYADDNISSFHWGDILDRGEEGHFVEITEDGSICLDCPSTEFDDTDDAFPEDSTDTQMESSDEWDEADDFNARMERDSSQAKTLKFKKTIKIGDGTLTIS